ncbi:MAG: hypothetical protein AUG50_03515 [Betaproteobacteria bacterium 13_1_20CM_3_63_8]|nr:MAG: hypothetical protein AUG50_03515 [Betaproteobacteria bacterium 13_1_20CM_3_63_8]
MPLAIAPKGSAPASAPTRTGDKDRRVASRDDRAFGDVGGDAPEVEAAFLLAKVEADHRDRGAEVEQHRDEIGACQAERLEHDAAGERAHDAGDAVGHRIESDRGGHPVRRDDLADHASPHRQFAGPDEAVDGAGDDDVPDLDRTEQCQRAEQRRGRRHDEELRDQDALAVERLADDAGERAGQQHR